VTGRRLLVVPLPGLVALAPPLGVGVAVPHVPIVDPFPPADDLDQGVVAELRGYFADVVPFPVRLGALTEFPGGPPYLTPEPPAPFRRLAHGLARLFPELPRPRGTVDLVPHLTVPAAPGTPVEELRERLEPWLPVTTVAREAALWSWAEDGVRTLATFPFGTTAA